MNRTIIFRYLFLISLFFFTSGCVGSDELTSENPGSDEKLQVVATTTNVADVVK